MTVIVCRLPNGCTLYRETNGVGGHRYWSDEIGGGVMLWDTSLVDRSTLLTAIVEEHRAMREELRNQKSQQFDTAPDLELWLKKDQKDG